MSQKQKVKQTKCIWPIIHAIAAFANDIDNYGSGYIVVGIAEYNGMPGIPISGLNKGYLLPCPL